MSANSGPEKAVILESVNGEPPDAARVSAALGEEIARQFGPPENASVACLAYANEELVGGLTGLMHWRWLYIRHLWVARAWRRAGVGRDLLARAERDARARNCVGLYIDTFDPDIARFYERRGFERHGEIENFPPGHARIFLSKPL